MGFPYERRRFRVSGKGVNGIAGPKPAAVSSVMTEEQLRAAIASIRAELDQAAGLSELEKSSLLKLAEELEQRLGQRGGPVVDDSMRSRLADWVRMLEATHPTLSTKIDWVLETLALFNL